MVCVCHSGCIVESSAVALNKHCTIHRVLHLFSNSNVSLMEQTGRSTSPSFIDSSHSLYIIQFVLFPTYPSQPEEDPCINAIVEIFQHTNACLSSREYDDVHRLALQDRQCGGLLVDHDVEMARTSTRRSATICAPDDHDEGSTDFELPFFLRARPACR